jgi:hypothetical protein
MGKVKVLAIAFLLFWMDGFGYSRMESGEK